MFGINSLRCGRLASIPSLLICAMVTCGCGQTTPRIDATSQKPLPRIDATSEKSYNASMAAMKAGMTANEVREFDNIILGYMWAIVPQLTAKASNKRGKQAGASSEKEVAQTVALEMRRSLHGLTLPQVKEKALAATAEMHKLRAQRLERGGVDRRLIAPPAPDTASNDVPATPPLQPMP